MEILEQNSQPHFENMTQQKKIKIEEVQTKRAYLLFVAFKQDLNLNFNTHPLIIMVFSISVFRQIHNTHQNRSTVFAFLEILKTKNRIVGND